MFLNERIKSFSELGNRLKSLTEDDINGLAQKAGNQNAWFTTRSVKKAFNGIAKFLDQAVLTKWLSNYELETISSRKIGVIAAGNIPLVGFHDVMCVLLSGHKLNLKMSSDDGVLMNYVLDELCVINAEWKNEIEVIERLNDAEAFIATGSDNSARYFKYYFKDRPNIIRANRTSVAVLDGTEINKELSDLGNDIFEYYGLGCRNVSKVFVPEEYDFKVLLDALNDFEWVGDHHKYRNNYDYNKSIYLVNKEPHLDSGFLLMRESDQLVSPISVLFHETYQNQNELDQKLKSNKEKIQCTVGHDHVPFGQAQMPEVWDYADGVDTLEFLTSF